MLHPSPVEAAFARRLLERLVWVAVGAGVSAWILHGGDSRSNAEMPATEDVHDEEPGAMMAAAVMQSDAGGRRDGSTTSVAGSLPLNAADPGAWSKDTTSAQADIAPRCGPQQVPTLGLPAMPGSLRVSESARWDAEGSSWVLKHAYRIFAHPDHAIAFYERALADLELRVSLRRDGPEADPAAATYLTGRGLGTHVQVGIRRRSEDGGTYVWIMWRQRGPRCDDNP